MVRKNSYRRSLRTERTRKGRCQSADSGVDTTLNNTTVPPVPIPYNQFNGMSVDSLPVKIPRTRAVDELLRSLSIIPQNSPKPKSSSLVADQCPCRCSANRNRKAAKVVGLEEEHLDFEPDGGEREFALESASQHSNFSRSTLKIADSESPEPDNDNHSLSTVSIHSRGHLRDMFPVPRIDAKDGRQNMYFPLSCTSSTRTFLDSSSDESCSSDPDNVVTETEDDLSRGQHFDDSGDFYNEEDDSECNLSQEEEERLLEGSDDEPQTITVDRRQLEVCQFGNVRITLPKINNNVSDEVLKPCDLKIGKTNVVVERGKKRKKWDLHYKPDLMPTQVFLDDLGYVPEYERCDDVDGVNVSHNKKLIVICNDKDKIVCEKSADELQRNITFPKNDDSAFKLPLPPVKRPPTRPKRTVSNLNKSNSNLQIQVFNKPVDVRPQVPRSFSSNSCAGSSRQSEVDKDDTISLIASSIGDQNEDINEDFSSVESSFVSPESSDKEEPPSDDANYTNSRVENWIETVPDAKQTETVTSQMNNQRETPTHVESAATSDPQKGPTINFKDIPFLLNGVCYYYYFCEGCFRSKSCHRMHYVNREKFVAKFKNSSPEQLMKCYNLAMKYEKLFKEIYPCFLMAFGALKMHNELMMAIKDLLQIDYVNTFKAVDIVVQAFVDSGVSFLDTIERISFNVGFLQYPVLADILLDLITRKPNIAENWEVISRIARARGHISPDIARRVLITVTAHYPVDKRLCLDIYNVLVTKRMTDLSQISVDLITPFRAIVGFQELEPPPAQLQAPSHVGPPIVRLQPTLERDRLSAHIDVNLIRERERFERGEDHAPHQIGSHTPHGITGHASHQISGHAPHQIVGHAPLGLSQSPVDRWPAFSDTDYGEGQMSEVRSYDEDERCFPGTNRRLVDMHVDGNTCGFEDNNRFYPGGNGRVGEITGFEDNDRFYPGGNGRVGETSVFEENDRFFPGGNRGVVDRKVGAGVEGRRSGSESRRSGASGSGSRKSGASSNGSFEGASSPSSLHFEPPVLGEYVPENVRRIEEVRTETSSSRNFSPVFDTPAESPIPIDGGFTLTPNLPIMGRPNYRHDFKLNVSLHNLQPEPKDMVNINERDIAKLNRAIFTKNAVEFCRLLESYKAPATITNFCTMMLAHLRQRNSGPYELLVGLIDALEMERPDFHKDIHFKVVFEVVIMNLLFDLERRGHWEKARRLLERFCDWDSLVSSKIFPRKMTHMGRYLFLAKVLAKGKNYHLVSEILQCPSLHLLEPTDNWPFPHDPQVDMRNRNSVLRDFFQDGFLYNIMDVASMFRRVYRQSAIYGYDACPMFNPMLVAIMNRNQSMWLKHFYRDIDVYHKVMEKNVLRAFTILMANQLNREELYRLYDLCCNKQIYTYYTGCETSIIVRTNMLDRELEFILSYYMDKKAKNGSMPLEDLHIIIKLFESNPLYPKMLHKCVRSVADVNQKVREILLNEFGICVKDIPDKPTVVQVQLDSLRDWLLRTQRRFSPFGRC